ncbi:flagellar hook-associated protein FlgK [Methylobacterium iners]|uniref:Flagellar hook-associated protein 1 n=1 Tax=Methylobacterium iners TaxID=418707 RepID=A0ABQ4RU87_9HYPH|nr:flagellar hook-associated protein FlgK [Methylobacterium iners]GJD93120.1 hypothetical protein OCOJLMKI_0309 [Methylobacterium iners]
MSFNALNTATAGLRVTQASIGVVSQNIANVGTTGYVKRTLTSVAGGIGNAGVATGTIGRALDAASLKQLRLETSGAAYTSGIADLRSQLDKLFGTPGSSTALDGAVNNFALSLQELAADPTSPPARSTVVDRAAALAAKITDIAEGVQDLRSAAEAQLSNDTIEANGFLSSIADLNAKVAATTDPATRANLLDQRDQKLTGLSAFLDIQTVPQKDGSVSVLTGSGVTLVERNIVTALSFDGRSTLSPDAAYTTDPTTRGVGTITATTPGGAKIDLIASNAIRSGSLAAGIELRDTILPQAQRQLDDLAAGVARSVSDRQEAVAATGGSLALDLTGLKPGNAITVALRTPDGATRNLILVPTSGDPSAAIDPAQTNDANAFAQSFDISGGPSTYGARIAEAITALSARLGGTQPVPDITASGGAAAVTFASPGNWEVLGASAGITVPNAPEDTSAQGVPQMALFIDGNGSGSLFTGSFDPGSQLTGFAQRITVNPAVVAKTSSLVNFTTSPQTGDTTRPDFLYDALTKTNLTFSAASGIGGVRAPFSDSVQGFTQRIIDAQGAGAASAQDLDEGQRIALSTAQGRFASESGVSIDEEMSNLIQLQTAYNANARVLTAARDMLDTLMRI